jgi:hypothetical protein
VALLLDASSKDIFVILMADFLSSPQPVGDISLPEGDMNL